MAIHKISSALLNFEDILRILRESYQLELSDEAITKIQKCRDYLDRRITDSDDPIYGINTGFGALHNVRISKDDLGKLQQNLVMSHACGTGEEVPQEIVKLMLLLKAHALSYGHSGVQVATVQRLIDFFNHDVLPVVYQQGSLGASGDLAPLAHLSLPLIGMGEVYFKGQKMPASYVNNVMGWEPISLQSKEGLALLNGTQFMSAYGIYLCLRVFKLSRLADIIGALSLDAFDGRIEPFHHLIQQIRHHKGQIKTAQRIRNILKDSKLIKRQKAHIQDPYSFRCIPQVHGASKDSIDYVAYVFRMEINAVTDNPTVFPDEDLIISAGNFHGQPLALALDNLCIAMAELGNISERRTYQLLEGKRGLPHFLVANSGLNSGFMIPQYTAASIVNQNKQLCTPASVDTIESSQGQEDHVSMGANAATKAYRVLENLERILAIELLNAAQALDFRRPETTSPYLEEFVAKYREKVQFIENDKVMYNDINTSVKFLQDVVFELPDEDVSVFKL
ncbi:MAG: histidine ammonia-lyase [Bacteroidales bacterium]|jgi:histidine ammonia-lyase|nr:histidine ammonia-lyase [Bacteroidales bacterium]MDI9592105.1 histidine ammonia-lyase [Bacteroidota bacterium]NLH33016.1 histidine ammonia-lyase [Lentimicrobium sp.]MBP7874516.1 histidine ammonia-lyase [Bacteroidales bacterium]MCO6467357.1 histidine ammonia-lyase [Bacteroidales bacterium]